MLNKNKITELIKKLQNVTLLKMDNDIQAALNCSYNSIFDGETDMYISDGEYAYTDEYNVKFSVIEENEDPLNVVISVSDIELL